MYFNTRVINKKAKIQNAIKHRRLVQIMYLMLHWLELLLQNVLAKYRKNKMPKKNILEQSYFTYSMLLII